MNAPLLAVRGLRKRFGGLVVTDDVDLDVQCPSPSERGERVRWWVTYQRVAEAHRGDVPADADIESEVRLHEGSPCEARETP